VIETPGHGLEASDLAGRRWRLGSARWLDVAPVEGAALYFGAAEGGRATAFLFDEALREGAAEAVAALRAQGVEVSLLSGDSAPRVARLAERLDIADATAAATPERKLALLRDAQAGGARVAMVGDGVNDAPVLAQADVSFAMAEGASIAQRAADAVLLSGRLADVPQAIALARRAQRVMRQNLAWAALYNAACVPLAFLGWLPPWAAGLGMALSSLFVVLNALRLSRVVA
jgi:Cu2+-exporting ATPase